VFLVVADGIITRFLISRGLGVELNPFLKTWVGSDTFLWIKLGGALMAALILWDLSGWDRSPGKLRASITIGCLVAFYAAIVIWNLFVLFTATM